MKRPERRGWFSRLAASFRRWLASWRARRPETLDDFKLTITILLTALVILFGLAALSGRSEQAITAAALLDETPTSTQSLATPSPVFTATSQLLESATPIASDNTVDAPSPQAATPTPLGGPVAGGGGTSAPPVNAAPEGPGPSGASGMTPVPAPESCPGAVASQLAVGTTARTAREVNVRASPGIGQNWLFSLPEGAVVSVVGGPQCVPYGSMAYLWWQIETEEGVRGWSAEGSSSGEFYFLIPGL